jgi:hypothetical protein
MQILDDALQALVDAGTVHADEAQRLATGRITPRAAQPARPPAAAVPSGR